MLFVFVQWGLLIGRPGPSLCMRWRRDVWTGRILLSGLWIGSARPRSPLLARPNLRRPRNAYADISMMVAALMKPTTALIVMCVVFVVEVGRLASIQRLNVCLNPKEANQATEWPRRTCPDHLTGPRSAWTRGCFIWTIMVRTFYVPCCVLLVLTIVTM